MASYTLKLARVHGGWAVYRSDGRQLARYWGVGARQRAEHFARTYRRSPGR